MSTISNKQPLPEFDYWEFVHCAVCFLPFLRDVQDVNSRSPTVPFWLTECGHTVSRSKLYGMRCHEHQADSTATRGARGHPRPAN
ncbi:hypothetical protein Clacol_006985 [Clathrus columnatus]|uniref:Uncharacterized protein n=1 Tax=Clathrus columnatus TaxID=1419009 RepID=A0AAV5AIR8_9AGAM|nr:hypothetical protein Clacol_006985 [Clathrus columnatus]